MNLRPGQIVVLAAGAVLLVFSFFSFYELDFTAGGDISDAQIEQVCSQLDDLDLSAATDEEASGVRLLCSNRDGASAWNTDLNAPLSLWPVLIGVVVALLVVADAFTNVDPPEVAGFSAPQLAAALAFSGASIMLGFLVMGTEQGQEFGIGFWFLLLGSVALLVGAVMELLQGPAGSVRPVPGRPGDGTPPGPGPSAF